MKRLLAATTNAGKLAELAPVLAALGFGVVGLAAFPRYVPPEETGATLAENAELKARHGAAATGLPTLADDSGLEVAALGGAPGVHSARFAGAGATDAGNRALLLQRLQGVTDRSAAFTCWLCLVEDGRVAALVSGRCTGSILEAPCGTGGFGYDSLFVPDDPAAGGRSFAELGREQKQALSHRGRALLALGEALRVGVPR